MTDLKRKKTGEHLLEHDENGLLYFTFPSLDTVPFIIHGFSSRLGGVSENELSSLNLSFTRGDDEKRVRENFRRIAQAIGFSPASMVFSAQTHTTNVRRVNASDRGKGFVRERDYTDTDALITDDPDVILTGFFADCVPLYFADPVRRAVGLAHSGWRGTVSDIAGATVEAMHKEFGTAPSDLFAAIGPSICRDCYEVREDVISRVRENYPREVWPLLFEEKGGGSYQLDLWEACRQNLLRAKVLPERIFVTDLCTCCNPDVLFSHRASGGKRGNLAAFLGIRS